MQSDRPDIKHGPDSRRWLLAATDTSDCTICHKYTNAGRTRIRAISGNRSRFDSLKHGDAVSTAWQWHLVTVLAEKPGQLANASELLLKSLCKRSKSRLVRI